MTTLLLERKEIIARAAKEKITCCHHLFYAGGKLCFSMLSVAANSKKRTTYKHCTIPTKIKLHSKLQGKNPKCWTTIMILRFLVTTWVILPRTDTEHAWSCVRGIQSHSSLWHEERVHSSTTNLPQTIIKGKVNFKNYIGSNGATAALSLESYCQKNRASVHTFRLDV